MAFAFAGHLAAGVVVYDCIDELSLFRGELPRLAPPERQLLRRANLVFTGGRSLHEAKWRVQGPTMKVRQATPSEPRPGCWRSGWAGNTTPATD